MTKKDLLFARIIEISWLVIAICMLFIAVNHSFVYKDYSQDTIVVGVCSLVSFGMYYLRRKKRIALKNK